MLAILSEKFQSLLRDCTAPVFVAAEFYDSCHHLEHYKLFYVFPFELVNFLTNFDKSGYSTVTFVGLFPSNTSNGFKRYHILTI